LATLPLRKKRNTAAVTILRNSPSFRGLDSESLREIEALCVDRRYATGETVFRQGEPGTALLGVVSGQIRITVNSEQGRELHLNLIEPGEIIGEIAFIDGGLRTATGTAAEPTTCFTINRAPFFALMDERPSISHHLLALLCERVCWTSRLVADSAFLSVPDRMLARLRDLSASGETTVDGGTRIRISQQELADYLGVSRQVVNGYLRNWQKAGQVRLSRGAITIQDLHTASTVHQE
jgi:CRP/FNR family cyclic AMP-dependent transcriptional regulator